MSVAYAALRPASYYRALIARLRAGEPVSALPAEHLALVQRQAGQLQERPERRLRPQSPAAV